MKLFRTTLTLILLVAFTINVKCKDKTNIYVWDFIPNKEETKVLAMQITNAFDEQLVQIGKPQYRILNRQDLADIIRHCENENAVMEIDHISACSSEVLEVHRAEVVVFGTVKDDDKNGFVTVQVKLQSFSTEIIAAESIDIQRFHTYNPQAIRKHMEVLVRKLLGKYPKPNIVVPLTSIASGVTASTIGWVNFLEIKDEYALKEEPTIIEWEIYNRKYRRNQALAYAGGAIFIAGVYWLYKSMRAKKDWEQNWSISPDVSNTPFVTQIPNNQSVGIKLAYKF